MNKSEANLLSLMIDKPQLIKSMAIEPNMFSTGEGVDIAHALLVLELNHETIDASTIAVRSNLSTERIREIHRGKYFAKEYDFDRYQTDIRRHWYVREQMNQISAISLMNLEADALAQAISQLQARTFEHTRSKTLATGFDELVEQWSNETYHEPIKTGFPDLDRAIKGFTPCHLVVLAARSAHGKTAIALNIATQQCLANVKVGFISSEQNLLEIAKRVLATFGPIDNGNLHSSTTITDQDWQNINRLQTQALFQNFLVNDEPSISIDEIIAQAREWVRRFGVEVIFVDYLQRVRSQGFNRVDQVARVARGLKSLAKELEIPVIALAQVARSVDDLPEGERQPQMRHLSDASEIEKESDIVMTLCREDVYTKQNTGQANVEICKNRHGPTYRINMRYDGKYFRFKDRSWAS